MCAPPRQGLDPRRIIVHHVVRNALIPVVHRCSRFIWVRCSAGPCWSSSCSIGRGLSGYLVRAVEQRDYPEVVGIVL